MTVETLVVPGMRLCVADEDNVPGPGTYSQNGYIYSSLAGTMKLLRDKKDVSKSGSSSEVRITVVPPCSGLSDIPSLGDIVTVRVIVVNPRFAKVQILCVRDSPLSEPFWGLIRKEDVRATEKDKVELYKSFRAGDIVLSRVISLGEASSGYLLSTAENELGVVIANSSFDKNSKLVPISWTKMQCPKTFNKEFRKIAKVVPEDIKNEDQS
uniref:3-5 exoribonuclease CSL4 homolog n=1 Tax=Caligus clemensi TaxID=344056 RepID=C1C307_CALCM|nr:3-5 exoribonuclease CSL4 homolog [Caligus clemensi]